MLKGFFISVEGVDGSGKSSHIAFIQEYLVNNGYQVINTREPGGTPMGEKIREVLLSTDNEMHNMTELYLLFASRQELIKNIILPNLDKGVCVLSDRFTDSSIAYQGYGRGIGVKKVEAIINLLEPCLKPDLTLLFDVDLNVATQRLEKNNKKDRIEKENREFFQKVQNGYYAIAKKEPQRVKLINTLQTKEDTRQEIKQYLDQLLGKEKSDI
jgi:dTMP kinase